MGSSVGRKWQGSDGQWKMCHVKSMEGHLLLGSELDSGKEIVPEERKMGNAC